MLFLIGLIFNFLLEISFLEVLAWSWSMVMVLVMVLVMVFFCHGLGHSFIHGHIDAPVLV